MNPYTEREDAMANGEVAANSHMVGGTHYIDASNGGEQHWDMMWRLYREAWFVGAVTKYILRYRRKDGMKDLLKARHYLDKLIELEQVDLNKHQLAKATQPLPIENSPCEYLHYRLVDGGGSVCNGGHVVTTNREQDVTCPDCKSMIDHKEYE